MKTQSFNQTETAQSCIDACLVCLYDAERCLEKSLEQLKVHNHPDLLADCLRACRDVSSITGLCASLLLREDELSIDTCRVCAQICWRAAVLCGGQFQINFLRCAESTQICAELCEQLVFAHQNSFNNLA